MEEAVPGNSSDIESQLASQLPSKLNFRSRFIFAGAGAGKTTKLISTFLEFVKEFKKVFGEYPKVVMTTFTRKATQEVKERLLVSALESGEKEIFQYINKKSSVHISTIHGLLSIYLSQFAERMKFPQEIMIVDDAQIDRRLKKQINELLKTRPQYLELMETYSFLQLVEFANEALNFKAQNPEFAFISEIALRKIAKQKKQEITDGIEKIFSLVNSKPYLYISFLKIKITSNSLESFSDSISSLKGSILIASPF